MGEEAEREMKEGLQFYGGRRVLVTGHTGFKGTWLSWLLSALGAEVYGIALPPQPGSLHEKAAPPLADSCLTDIRNGEAVRRVVGQFQPELVFHLAAHAYLDGSYDYPADIFEINLMGTVRLLDALRSRCVPTVVVTSDKCYAWQPDGRPCREDDPLGVAESYSASKACQDLAAQSYQYAFPEMAVATARASNTIGGGDFNRSRLVPYLLECFSGGVPARLRNPGFVRPWQYVLDVLWGYLTLGKALTEGCITGSHAFNFGPAPDGFQTVEQVARLLSAYFREASVEWQAAGKSTENALLRLDSSKAWRELGWQPLYTLEETLMQTAGFHQAMRKRPAEELCREQAAQYLARAKERGQL